jgi:hypothetical protein
LCWRLQTWRRWLAICRCAWNPESCHPFLYAGSTQQTAVCCLTAASARGLGRLLRVASV